MLLISTGVTSDVSGIEAFVSLEEATTLRPQIPGLQRVVRPSCLEDDK